jgi:hypothetical protein
VHLRLELRDHPQRAARFFGALLAVAVALTVLVATGALDESGGSSPPPPIEAEPRAFV